MFIDNPEKQIPIHIIDAWRVHHHLLGQSPGLVLFLLVVSSLVLFLLVLFPLVLYQGSGNEDPRVYCEVQHRGVQFSGPHGTGS